MRVTDLDVEKVGERTSPFDPCNRAMRGCKCAYGK